MRLPGGAVAEGRDRGDGYYLVSLPGCTNQVAEPVVLRYTSEDAPALAAD